MKRFISRYSKMLHLLPFSLRAKVYRRLVIVPLTLPKHIHFKFASTQDEFTQAFHLLHDSYLDHHYIIPHASGMWITPYHALPTTYTLMAIDTNTNIVIGTVSIIRDSDFALPCAQVIDLEKIRMDKRPYAEISALAIKKEYRGKILFPLIKFAYEACLHRLHIDKITATVNAQSKAPELYEALLLFRKIDKLPSAHYTSVNCQAVTTMLLDFEEVPERYWLYYQNTPYCRNLYHFFIHLSLDEYFELPHQKHCNNGLNETLFYHFFCKETSCLQDMTPHQINILKRVYKGLPHEQIINDCYTNANNTD